jgi:hypothetical protein
MTYPVRPSAKTSSACVLAAAQPARQWRLEFGAMLAALAGAMVLNALMI